MYIYMCTHTYCIFLNQSFICCGHSGCLRILVIVNSAKVNNAMHVSSRVVEFLSFLVTCPEVGLLDHMVALFLVF